MSAKVTERTFYPFLMQIIRDQGGKGVSEVRYNSEPDIIFDLIDRKWILGVKIGESIPILKKAFIQYHRHKDESKIKNGILVFLPEEARNVKPEEHSVALVLTQKRCTCLVDTPDIKEELSDITFPQILLRIRQEIIPALARRERKEYPLNTVIQMLQQHVSEMMQNILLSNKQMMRIITDKELLSEIGHLDKNESVDTARFLASYIVLSQILFLRLFSRTRPDIIPAREFNKKITHNWLRTAFNRVLDVNYRPIFGLDVLDAIPENYLQDTFDLIWGLEVERIRYELPGRLFHELMPKDIRKMLAAFYTRPQAAELLARLTISKGNQSVYDPSCGSGTILVSAYRRKLEVSQREGIASNPHKRFCEQEIFGSDIMPFAVHLTTANLASMDPTTTIEKAQIIQGDSLKLSRGYKYTSGIQLTLFPSVRQGYNMKGERQDIDLEKVDVVIMNPPFTKVERGITKYVDMKRFGDICGNEIGLWGHFIAFADDLLNEGGVFGGVIPISILRGRETQKIKDFVFSNWTPLYILKSTLNYGFSEWSEYRDVLLIARKGKPPNGHRVKFVLLKTDLTKLTRQDISHFANQIETLEDYRSSELDIEAFDMNEIQQRFGNLMWFCGASDMENRHKLVSFIRKGSNGLTIPPEKYFREGYRPIPKGVSSFMFLTRAIGSSREEEAFLTFKEDSNEIIKAEGQLGIQYHIEKSALKKSLRTGIGIDTMDITEKLDYIAFTPYRELERVLKASNFKKPGGFSWKDFWTDVANELNNVETKIVTLNRINPYSPSTHLISFFSKNKFPPSNTLNVVKELDEDTAKAFCVLMNSILFLAQFFLLKEETTGRYMHIRFYDFYEMAIFPKLRAYPNNIDTLARFA